MNKFYAYIAPIGLLIFSFAITSFTNNEFILYVGWIISLIWLNRVAHSYHNVVLRILTTTFLIITIIWTICLLIWSSAW